MCALISSSSFAASPTPLLFSNDDQINVYLSHANPNKIIVSGDIISNENGLEGQYSITKSPDGGIIILPVESKEVFNIYLNTRFGRALSLAVHTNKGNGKTYVLQALDKPKFVDNEEAKAWEESQPYVQTIQEILKSVTNQKSPPDYFEYELNAKNKKPSYQPYSPIMIEREKLWVGSNLSVTQYKMKNESNQSLNLQERYFYSDGVRAVSVSKKRLLPREDGLVWIVTETAKTFGGE